MKTQMFDLKTLIIGLLLGVSMMLGIAAVRGDAPQKLDADYRYHISAVRDGNAEYIYILDHETNKVYRRQFWHTDQGWDVKRAIANPN